LILLIIIWRAIKKVHTTRLNYVVEFLDPFFEELGWDITNKQGYAEAYKDVIHEDAIKLVVLQKHRTIVSV